VIDGRIGFLGGINIGDEYLGQDPKLGFWRDTHVKVEGDAVFFLQKTFLADWAIVSGQRLSGRALFPSHQCTGDSRVQIIASGPDLNRDTILGMYFGAITTAQHRVYIATPYFIPDPGLLLAIKSAAASGLDVRIILPGVSDSRLVKWASMSYLEELMDAGVRIYQYRRGFMHAKVLLVDDLVASVGTANMDMRSLFDNFELNAVLFDEKSLKRLADDFHQDLKDSEEIDPESFKSRSRWQKGREVIARMLSPLL
jgi:cardiolipin synthase